MSRLSYISIMCLIIGCALVPNISFASSSVVINEIMYDVTGTDSDREWIEIYNAGTSSVDISSWKFFEEGSNHSLVAHTGSLVIPSGGYAVIVDSPTAFLEDWSAFDGVVIDSSWSSFSNNGEPLALKDGVGVVMNEVTYDPLIGAAGDGKSLQLVDGVWGAYTPTPGETNQASLQNEEDTEENENNNTTNSTPVVLETKEPKPYITFDAPQRIPAGVWFEIEPTVYDPNGNDLFAGVFVWNMGDGSSKTDSYRKTTQYMYQYPGTYVVTLDYYRYQFEMRGNPYATNRVTIQVLAPGIEISAVNKVDASITFKNTSSYEIDIGGWVVRGGFNLFHFPDRTIILPGKSMTLGSSVSQFTQNDLASVSIETSGGSLADIVEEKKEVVPMKKVSTRNVQAPTSTPPQTVSISPIVEDINQQASVISSLSSDYEEVESGGSRFVWWILFIFLMIGSAGALIFLRTKKKEPEATTNEADEYTFVE